MIPEVVREAPRGALRLAALLRREDAPERRRVVDRELGAEARAAEAVREKALCRLRSPRSLRTKTKKSP